MGTIYYCEGESANSIYPGRFNYILSVLLIPSPDKDLRAAWDMRHAEISAKNRAQTKATPTNYWRFTLFTVLSIFIS